MAGAWKTVRVFISSTFKDMQAERDYLVRFVFPRLREDLLRRRMHLVDVDLRWGVTADQDAFELCMDEIERCRPRFICILGGRYGWVPPPKQVDVDFLDRVLEASSAAGSISTQQRTILQYLYLRDDATRSYRLREKPQETDRVQLWNAECAAAVEVLQRAGLAAAQFSITASEIHYGVIDRLGTPGHHYFYFRDQAVTDSIPDPYAGSYREPDGSVAQQALAELKQSIRDARLPVYDYPCEWDSTQGRIARLEAFGARVYEDLMASVVAEEGEEAPAELDEFAEERAAMDSFIETRVERYVVGSRGDVLEAMRQHAESSGDNGYLCVVGEPGSGKSALLGKFYRDYVDGTDAWPRHADHLVIAHFVGASAASTNVRQVLRRFCHELAEGAGFEEEIPDDYEELRKAFPSFLEKAAASRHVVILIDAINQMDPALNAHNMRWLPDVLPSGVRIILSSLAGPALDSLRARRQPPLEQQLRPLDASDATAIIEGFLERYRKTLDGQQRATLLDKQDAGIPLYLLTALEELRTLGTYEEITNRIRELPGQAQPLFDWILNRLERDPGFYDEQGQLIGSELVPRYCAYIAVGRSGMSQAELTELIAPGDPQGNVAAVQRLLRAYLMQRGGLLDFFHGQLREAVRARYLVDHDANLTVHRAIAGYFRQKADPGSDASWSANHVRGLSELPYHQTEGEMWEELYKTLTDLGFLEAKCTHVGVATAGKGPDARKVYGGVYELQEDYRRAIERLPS
jgi:hypothetical protein